MSELSQFDVSVLDGHKLPRKASACLRRLLNGKQLDSRSLEWLLRVFDTFPDDVPRGVSWPDGSQGVLSRCVPKLVTVSKPAGLTAGAKWDLIAIAHPFVFNNSGNGYYSVSGQAPGVATALFPMNTGVTVFATNTGAWDLSATGGTWVDCTAGLNFQPGTDVPSGTPYRMVATGIEINDVTPELYRGGTLTAVELPCVPQQVCLSTAVGAANALLPYWWVDGMPTTLPALAGTPNAVSWEAPKGAYLSVMPNSQDNPICGPTNYSGIWAAQAMDVIYANVKTFSGTPTKVMPFDGKVVVLSGLDPNAAFTFKVHYYTEEKPYIGSANLPLAKEGAPYDPVALELMSKARDACPIAVTVEENPLGEWFTSICDAIANVAPVLSGVLPGPVGLVAKGVGMAASAAASYNHKQMMREKEKAKSANAQAQAARVQVQAVRQAALRAGAKKAPVAFKAQKKFAKPK